MLWCKVSIHHRVRDICIIFSSISSCDQCENEYQLRQFLAGVAGSTFSRTGCGIWEGPKEPLPLDKCRGCAALHTPWLGNAFNELLQAFLVVTADEDDA